MNLRYNIAKIFLTNKRLVENFGNKVYTLDDVYRLFIGGTGNDPLWQKQITNEVTADVVDQIKQFINQGKINDPPKDSDWYKFLYPEVKQSATSKGSGIAESSSTITKGKTKVVVPLTKVNANAKSNANAIGNSYNDKIPGEIGNKIKTSLDGGKTIKKQLGIIEVYDARDLFLKHLFWQGELPTTISSSIASNRLLMI